jgi:hypothetical protein
MSVFVTVEEMAACPRSGIYVTLSDEACETPGSAGRDCRLPRYLVLSLEILPVVLGMQ